ncbi:MAG: CheY-like chemotaxis protein [Limisphaerales bacterium]|jgi:CheY-like chemotaxis protein
MTDDKRRIVFIDDNRPNNVFSRIIIDTDQIPLIPVAFTHPEQAMEYLDRCHTCFEDADPFPDYVILDLNMPKLDGFSFVKEYETRFKHAYPETRLFIMSTTKRFEDEQRALTFSTVFGFFEKPFSKEIANVIMEKTT